MPTTAMPDEQLPILYTFRRCPYAMRARLAIASSKQDCEVREIVLRDKPEEMLEASPKGTVPVMVLPSGRVIDQSLDIMQWALAENDPDNWMSEEPSLQEEALQLISDIDGEFKHHLDHYKYANRYGVDPVEHRGAALTILESLDKKLQAQPFLQGQSPTIADHAIFPFVRQFANTDREWFDSQPLPALQSWLSRFLEGKLFNDIMPKLKPWQTDDQKINFLETYF
jgi:glutathione S-transferase